MTTLGTKLQFSTTIPTEAPSGSPVDPPMDLHTANNSRGVTAEGTQIPTTGDINNGNQHIGE
jgi:hypothetical protein